MFTTKLASIGTSLADPMVLGLTLASWTDWFLSVAQLHDLVQAGFIIRVVLLKLVEGKHWKTSQCLAEEVRMVRN